MIKILFVCHGNICRSPMAEFIMKKLVKDAHCGKDFSIDSCAVSSEEIGNGIYPPARRKLIEKGVPFDGHRARRITWEDYLSADYVIAMDRSNLSLLSRITHGDPDRKVHLLLSFAGRSADISDPWYSGDFETAYQDISEGCAALLRTLHK